MNVYKFVFSLVSPDEAEPGCWTQSKSLFQCFVDVHHDDTDAAWGKVVAFAAFQYPGLKVVPHHAFFSPAAQLEHTNKLID